MQVKVVKAHQIMRRWSNVHGAKREIFIPKGNGKTPPIAISSFEGKIVEWVLGKLLQFVFEPLFSPNSFGFRPRKSYHDERRYVVEIDSSEERGGSSTL